MVTIFVMIELKKLLTQLLEEFERVICHIEALSVEKAAKE